jgi:hypothetical protein
MILINYIFKYAHHYLFALLQGQASSCTLDVDYHYWPTSQLFRRKDSHGGTEWILEVA